MTQEDCKISVIIATRNRAEALEKISLPALAKQTFKDFEVIVWDASDNEDSSDVVKRFTELNIRYFKAPRLGSCSQRNDAVKVAKGEIIYFVDDDSEPSPDALEAIYEAMSTGEIAGCSPPEKRGVISKRKITKAIEKIFNRIFCLGGEGKFKRVLKSGRNEWPERETAGPAEWLHGGSIALRREIFLHHKFDEELEKFGGYALGEDVMFSYGLFCEGFRLKILEKGYFIHHNIPGGRGDRISKGAASIYNFFLIWRKIIYPSNKASLFPFLMSIIGTFLKGIRDLVREGKIDRLKGITLGFMAMLKRARGKP